jgi:transposase
MPPPLSVDLKERIVKWYFEDGLTYRDIQAQGRVSLSVISSTIRNYQEFGQVKNPFRRYTGRPSYLNDEDMAFIESTMTANPSIYLDELQKRLSNTRNLNISLATLSRALTSAQYSRKSLTKVSAERDEELRSVWEIAMAEYTDPEVFVFLDESAVDNKTVQRSHGWSKVGQPCVRRMTFHRGKKYSILPALATDGIIGLEIFEGSVTKEKFLSFLRTHVVSDLTRLFYFHLVIRQAQKLNPYPGKYSVVVMDNCSIHHDEDIRQLIVDECGEHILHSYLCCY